jgi:hypothetical protein
VDKVTGAQTILKSRTLGGRGIALDARAIYWTSEGYWDGTDAGYQESGKVFKASLPDGVVTTLAEGQAKPSGLVIDARYVYWLNWGTGELMRAAK